MTLSPKEKAKELVEKFYQSQVEILAKNGTAPIDSFELEIAKKSALISVDDTINSYEEYDQIQSQHLINQAIKYYKEVKQELEKL